MAFLSTCPICKGRLLNQHVHDSCESANLQDILLRVQNEIKKGKARDLPKTLRKEVLSLGLKPLSDFLEKKTKKQKRPLWSVTDKILEDISK